jgi:hypothetical protein
MSTKSAGHLRTKSKREVGSSNHFLLVIKIISRLTTIIIVLTSVRWTTIGQSVNQVGQPTMSGQSVGKVSKAKANDLRT